MVWERALRDAEDLFKDLAGYTLGLSDASGPRKSIHSYSPKGAMEINKAYVVITSAFAEERHAPYRVGMKFDYEDVFIEATFVKPKVEEQFCPKLGELTEQIGWSIRIRQSANQEQIALDARRPTPKSCFVRGAAKFYASEWRVVVRFQKLPRSVDSI